LIKMVGNQRLRERRCLNENEILDIQDKYGLKISKQKPFLEGMRSNTLFLETNFGKKVIKIYPNNFSYDLIKFQTKVCNYMNSKGVPTPKIFSNTKDCLVTPYQDAHYIIMQHLQGKPPTLDNPKIIPWTFKGLALSLNTLSKFKPKEVYVAPEIDISLTEQLNELKEAIRRRGEGKVDPIVESYQGRLDNICQHVETKLNNLNVSKQLILGDYNSGSLLIKDGEISGILDFDLLHLQHKGYDFMHIFDIFFIDKKSKNLPLEKRVDWVKLKDSMMFYSKFDPEIVDQIYTFPLMHQVLGLRSILDIWGNYYSGRSDRKYFEEKKEFYLPRLEIPTKLGERIIETLNEGYMEASKRF